MEKTIKNYKLTLTLVLISYIIMLVFNFFDFFDNNLIHVIYGIVAIILIVMMILSLKMSNEVIENSIKIIKIVAPIILVIVLVDGFIGETRVDWFVDKTSIESILFGEQLSPFKNYRVVAWIQLVGSIEMLLKVRKISKNIDY